MCVLKTWLLLCGLMVVLGLNLAFADEFGPLHVKNRFPLYLMFLSPTPVGAHGLSAGELRSVLAVDYSAIYFSHANSQWDFLMDMEMTTFDLALAYGLTPRVTIRLEMPLVSMNGGFLDGFLENYHDALGLPNYGREERPKNTFGYHVANQGETWIDGDSDGFQWADMTFSLQYQLTRPNRRRNPWEAALMGRIKFPVGDTDRGLGSGNYDFGFYLPVQWSRPPWNIYFMPGVAMISDPDPPERRIEARNSYSFFAGVGYAYTERLNLLIQVNYMSSPLENTGISELDDGGLELALGFQYQLGRFWAMEFAFCEDLTRAAPDFTLHLGLTWRYLSK